MQLRAVITVVRDAGTKQLGWGVGGQMSDWQYTLVHGTWDGMLLQLNVHFRHEGFHFMLLGACKHTPEYFN